MITQNTFIPLPISIQEFLLRTDAGFTVSIKAEYWVGRINVSISIKNEVGAYTSLTGVYLKCRYNDNAVNDPLEVDEAQYNVGTVNTPTGETTTLTHVFTGVLTEYSSRKGYIAFSSITPSINTQVPITTKQIETL